MKLLSTLIAAVFAAVSFSAIANEAAPAKTEAAAAPAKTEAAAAPAKKEAKKEAKKVEKKEEAKH